MPGAESVTVNWYPRMPEGVPPIAALTLREGLNLAVMTAEILVGRGLANFRWSAVFALNKVAGGRNGVYASCRTAEVEELP